MHRDRDSQFKTFPLQLHVRLRNSTCVLHFLIGMMCGKVNTIVLTLVDSTAWDTPRNTERYDASVIHFGKN